MTAHHGDTQLWISDSLEIDCSVCLCVCVPMYSYV